MGKNNFSFLFTMMSYRYSASAIGRLLISLFLVFVNSCIFTSGSTLEGKFCQCVSPSPAISKIYMKCGETSKIFFV